MSLGHAYAMALNGSSGTVVEIEVDLAAGLPGVNLIGLPDRSLGEATDRVKSALSNSGFSLPPRKLTVNLSPASLPKHGSGFDLAISLSCLAASGIVPRGALQSLVVVGELALDGRLRPTPGVLAAAVFAKKAGFTRVMVPSANRAEAELVPEIDVLGVDTLAQAAALLGAKTTQQSTQVHLPATAQVDNSQTAAATAFEEPDLADVYGQPEAIRALTVAAVGGHHIFMKGPPGVGKTMLASRLPTILPRLSIEQALDVACIRSLSGVAIGPDLPVCPPFEAPHHTVTTAAMVGGGSGALKPGVAARANSGVLFLDEATEFSQQVLDTLRQPLESGELSIQRAQQSAHFAARFQLVMAANPCPCGNYNSPELACECTPMVRRRYSARISGPLRDRIDIQISVAKALPPGISSANGSAETSAATRAKVTAARDIARERWHQLPWRLNAHVPGTLLRSRQWRLPRSVTQVADRALDKGLISMRGFDRVLRVAWSMADLDSNARPTADHVSEAYYLRTGKE